MTSDEVDLVVALVQNELGEELETCEEKPFGYDSLALAIVDAVYSLRANYAGVRNVISSYRRARASDGADANADGVPELMAALEKHGRPGLFRNETVAPGTSRRKYDVISAVAEKFERDGIRTRADFVERVRSGDSETVRKLWMSESGLGKVSWHYLLMLTGNHDVKADVWIRQFVARALSRQVSNERARLVVTAAAERLGVSPTALDHIIWTTERERER